MIDEIIALIRASDGPGRGPRRRSWPSRSSSPRSRPSTSSTCTLGRLTRLGRTDLEEEMAELRADHRRARGDPRPTRASCARSSRTSWARSGRSSPTTAPHRDHLRPGDIDIEDLIDDEELVVTMSASGLHQDRPGRRLPHPGPRRPGRRRAPSCGTRTTSPTSSTPPPTPTCCSSRTGAGCTGSRRTRSR